MVTLTDVSTTQAEGIIRVNIRVIILSVANIALLYHAQAPKIRQLQIQNTLLNCLVILSKHRILPEL